MLHMVANLPPFAARNVGVSRQKLLLTPETPIEEQNEQEARYQLA